MSNLYAHPSLPYAMDDIASLNFAPPSVPGVPESADEPKPKGVQRSRSGCFTCRVRRKKCDEEKPSCKSCSKLSLKCDYKPPKWWATVEQRRRQKDLIKDRIRQSKIIEKEGNLKQYMERIHALAQKPSPVVPEYDFSRPMFAEQANPFAPSLPTPVTPQDMGFKSSTQINPYTPSLPTPVTPQEIGFKSSTQANPFAPSLPTPVTPQDMGFKPSPQVPLSNDQFLQTPSFSSYGQMSQPQHHTPTQTSDLPNNDWVQNTSLPCPPSYSPIDATGFFYPNPTQPLTASLHNLISLEDRDRPLLDNFVEHVIRLVFPILDINRGGPSRINEILNSLQNNRSYLHCCLSASAIHLKSSKGLEDQMDHDIMSHRYAAISQLCRILNRGSGQMQVMDATLGLIFYTSSVGTTDDYLPDIPWNAHFQAVSNIVKKLQCAPTQLNISLISWIDILGATMLGATPQFSHTYRTKHLSGTSSGLQQLMGCDDRIMYLISEIACLESLRLEEHLDDMTVFSHVSALSSQIDWTEPRDPTLENPTQYSSSGKVNAEMLTKVISSIFRIGTRIYLFSIIPGFDPSEPSIMNLVDSMVNVLQYMPIGPNGFDRCLVWPLFIAGAYSMPSSNFRRVLTERIAALGYLGEFGSFGRMYRVLKEHWRDVDETSLSTPVSSTMPPPSGGDMLLGYGVAGQQLPPPTRRQTHWRDTMRRNKWSYLLM